MTATTTLAAIAAVATGGMIGGLTRYLLAQTLPSRWGTFTANMLACLIVGFVTEKANTQALSPGLYAFAVAGLAGATSTWSTLAKELGNLLKSKKYAQCVGYLLATVSAGVALVYVGAQLG